MERVEAALNGSAQNLPEIGENRYQGKLNAPATKAKEVVYPVMITATGDNGGVTEETRDLIVRNADLFPLEFTIARKNGEQDYQETGKIFFQGLLFLMGLALFLYLTVHIVSPVIFKRSINSPEIYQAIIRYLD